MPGRGEDLCVCLERARWKTGERGHDKVLHFRTLTYAVRGAFDGGERAGQLCRDGMGARELEREPVDHLCLDRGAAEPAVVVHLGGPRSRGMHRERGALPAQEDAQ